jgi:hypothetical protein
MSKLLFFVLVVLILFHLTEQKPLGQNDKYFKKVNRSMTKLKKNNSFKNLQKKIKIYMQLTKKLVELNNQESENLLESDSLLFENLRKKIEDKLKIAGEDLKKSFNEGVKYVQESTKKIAKIVTITVQEVGKVNWGEEAKTQLKYFADPKVSLKDKTTRMVNNMNGGMSPIEFMSNKFPAFQTAIEMIPLNPWGIVNAIRGRDLNGKPLTKKERIFAAFSWASQPILMAAEKAAKGSKVFKGVLPKFPGKEKMINFLSKKLGPNNMKKLMTLAKIGKSTKKAYETFNTGKQFVENLQDFKEAIEKRDLSAILKTGLDVFTSGKKLKKGIQSTTASFRKTESINKVFTKFENTSQFKKLKKFYDSPNIRRISTVASKTSKFLSNKTVQKRIKQVSKILRKLQDRKQRKLNVVKQKESKFLRKLSKLIKKYVKKYDRRKVTHKKYSYSKRRNSDRKLKKVGGQKKNHRKSSQGKVSHHHKSQKRIFYGKVHRKIQPKIGNTRKAIQHHSNVPHKTPRKVVHQKVDSRKSVHHGVNPKTGKKGSNKASKKVSNKKK